MNFTKELFFFLILASAVTSSFAQTATLTGVVLGEDSTPIEDVMVASTDGNTKTNENGFYQLIMPSEEKITVTFSHVSFEKTSLTIQLKNGEYFEFNPVMKTEIEQIGEVVVSSRNQKSVEGIQNIEPEVVRSIPGANAGVENILKTLPGVNSNNELSTQYAVRGGNYDENLVYVNEIEVYRPFLIRSGQQEGMSFINTDLIQNIDFSAGGFQSKYGDKLSSVLDVTYKTPRQLTGGAHASFLGGSAFLGTASKDQKFTTLTGVRYRNNSLLINSTDVESNFNPVFADAQTFLTYRFSGRFQLQFLGNLSLNEYDYQPQSRQTTTGTFDRPIAIRVDYIGEEEDSYKTAFGALKGNYKLNEKTTLKFIASLFHTEEKEYYNIASRYRIGEINPEMGGLVEDFIEVGRQFEYARNDLDAIIFNLQHKGFYEIDETTVEWGVKYSYEKFDDLLDEFEAIDTTGFTNDSISFPNAWEIPSFNNINAQNNTENNRISGFAQWSKLAYLGDAKVWLNAGVRAQYWNVSGDSISSQSHFIVSPRAQFSIKPDWEKDMLFRIAGGVYQQPPFYRELRDSTGTVQPDVKAQKSYHLVLGHDYSFKLWDRPFKLISEAYYKYIDEVNPYTLENVRIRYAANNNAVAYAYGLDLRLNGEFVPGTESWVSLGYLKTEENIENNGYIPRPTDQRLKFAVLFQDYIPSIPNVKLYLNGVYNTGVPGGSPNYANPYEYQTRLPSYKRLDVGVNYVFVDGKQNVKPGHWTNKFKEIEVGFEIFNIFDIQNTITNTWVNDYYTNRQYAIPNYMTGRIFNIKAGLRF
ncbi:TonB-dependent receptor [Galbibacter mesophilus]|uniref:TonB-dependent receptor n=1 Tax=Galbibacter mesophilus TaxID=379069 RepID=UPI00191DEF71|nr:carboxypeptidase-like regulatory domain-containing protein [Galbibacter mesophilus]MCM5663001.1 carboxypeptidase-like regulatory domain-containing protein [Galbibacter mesophilus]